MSEANYRVSFSWIGLVVFALPMLINIAYAIFPPNGKVEQTAAVTPWIEVVEQISRIAYLLAITLLVSRKSFQFRALLPFFCFCTTSYGFDTLQAGEILHF